MNLQEAVAKKKKPSQHDLLRRHFDSGRRLTVRDALLEFGIYALSQRCGELKNDGYPLTSRVVKLENGKWCKEYRKR